MSFAEWLHDDITWCARECPDKKCERNKVNMRCKKGLHSVADMYKEGECPADADASAFEESLRKYREQVEKEKGGTDGTQAR